MKFKPNDIVVMTKDKLLEKHIWPPFWPYAKSFKKNEMLKIVKRYDEYKSTYYDTEGAAISIRGDYLRLATQRETFLYYIYGSKALIKGDE